MPFCHCLCVIGTYLVSKNLSVSQLCFAASAMEAEAALVEARTTGSVSTIKEFNENNWLALRGHLDCNVMSPTRKVLLASREYAVRLMGWADNVGANSIVVDAGFCPSTEHDRARLLTSSLRSISKRSTSNASLLIENGCGHDTGSMSIIRHAIDMAGDDRFGIHLNLTKAFAFGYTLEDLYNIDRQFVRSVQISLPEQTMTSGCGKMTTANLESCHWSPSEIQKLTQHFSDLPIIIRSTDVHDWALIELGNWAGISVFRDNNLAIGDSKNNRLGEIERP
jgi:hypothetical protein